ncbi:MAG: SH3 domain-containing protein [Mariprofundaceae bacterium]
MGRLIFAILVSLTMSGCVIVSAVGGVAGAAADGLFYLFKGSEHSFSMSMRSTLVSVQRGLKKNDLDVSVLEPVKEGYLIGFGNEELDGKIELTKKTKRLTTISVKVKHGALREESVEEALVESIRKESGKVKRSTRFDFRRYKNIREKPKKSAKRIGWYLPGKHLEVKPMKNSEWLRIKLPSGKSAYLKGNLAASAHK